MVAAGVSPTGRARLGREEEVCMTRRHPLFLAGSSGTVIVAGALPAIIRP